MRLWNHLTFSKDGKQIIYQPEFNPGSKTAQGTLLMEKYIATKESHEILAGIENSLREYCQQVKQISISPDGRLIVFSAYDNLFLVPFSKAPISQVIFSGENGDHVIPSGIRFASGVDPHWEEEGKALCWTHGNQYFRINPDKIIAASVYAQDNSRSYSVQTNPVTVDVKPDQVIDLNITAPVYHSKGTLALKNARIITMRGSEVIERGTLLIKDGRIKAVGSTTSFTIPADAEVKDLSGTTIMPGMIDIHLHFHGPEPDNLHQQYWPYLTNLAYGVTTARDPSSYQISYGYTELLLSGHIKGPRLYSSGSPARLFDGMFSCNNIEDAKRYVVNQANLGGTFIKQYMLPTRLQKQWLLVASTGAGLNMTNEGYFNPIMQWGMLKDGSTGLEHNPCWGDVYKDVEELIAKSGTTFTPTLQVCTGCAAKEYFKYTYWHQPDEKMSHFIKNGSGESLQQILTTPLPADIDIPLFLVADTVDAHIRKLGGKVALGSHGNNQGIGVHNELWALQMGGLTNMEALQAATIMGAEAIGIQQDVGSLEPGKIADLLVLNKNPLDDIHNSREIRYVMKDGILYDGNTLDEIGPAKKKLPKRNVKKADNHKSIKE